MASGNETSTQVWVGPRTWIEPVDDATQLAADLGVRPPKTWLPIDRERATELASRLLREAPDKGDATTAFLEHFAPTAHFLTSPSTADVKAVVGIDDVTIGMICLAA